MSEKRKGVIFCSCKEKWKEELEKRLQTDAKAMLLAIGNIRCKLFAYLREKT